METSEWERGTIAGGISVLMVFLTLCITIYGLLSLLAAENELSLNRKNRDAIASYYAADALAAEILSELASAETKGDLAVSADGAVPIHYDAGAGTASFAVPIDQYRDLDVSVSFPSGGGDFVINRYAVVNGFLWQEHTDSRIQVITEFE